VNTCPCPLTHPAPPTPVLVYVVEWVIAYEGSGIVSIHTTLEAAQKARDTLEANGDRYTDYIVTTHTLIGA
jgi:hypothetical protein